MAYRLYTRVVASIAELKENPMKTLAAGEGFPVAILNRNDLAFYCVPACAYDALLNRLEDLELSAIAGERTGLPVFKVKLDEL